MIRMGLAALVGVALMAVPDLVGLNEAPSNLLHIAGPIGAAFAFVGASQIARGLRWVVMLVGAVIVIGALLTGIPMPWLVVVIGAGALMSLLAFLAPPADRPYGGGWRSLVRSRSTTLG